MNIKKAQKQDARLLAELAVQLWPKHTVDALEGEFQTLLAHLDAACFIQYQEDIPIGFAHCQLRHDYVEGTSSSPVGYLEGIFVSAPWRQQGVAKALLSACEDWAKAQGCSEFASDCALGNTESIAFHRALGFTEENRIVCFRKDLLL